MEQGEGRLGLRVGGMTQRWRRGVQGQGEGRWGRLRSGRGDFLSGEEEEEAVEWVNRLDTGMSTRTEHWNGLMDWALEWVEGLGTGKGEKIGHWNE